MVKKLHLLLQKEAKFLHKVNHLEKIHLQVSNNLELLIWEGLANSLNNLMRMNHQKKFQIN